jgi:hypothetical protein
MVQSVHFVRNVLAHAGKSGRPVVSAFIATAFAQEDTEAAKGTQWRRVADQLRPKLPKLTVFLDEAVAVVVADMTSRPRTAPGPTPPTHWSASTVRSSAAPRSLASSPTRPIVRLVGAILLEQNVEGAVQRSRYMTLENVGALSDDLFVSLPTPAALPIRPRRRPR